MLGAGDEHPDRVSTLAEFCLSHSLDLATRNKPASAARWADAGLKILELYGALHPEIYLEVEDSAPQDLTNGVASHGDTERTIMNEDGFSIGWASPRPSSEDLGPT